MLIVIFLLILWNIVLTVYVATLLQDQHSMLQNILDIYRHLENIYKQSRNP